MITTDLFPNNPNLKFYVGATVNQFSCDCTYYFNDTANINFSAPNDLDGYYLGWMQPEDLPLCILTSSNAVEDNGNIKWVRTNPTENYRIGYGFASNTHQYPCQLRERDGTFTTSNLTGIAAFNTFYPEFFGAPRSISFNFVYGIYEDDGETFKYYTQANDSYSFTDWTEFLAFCNGETSLTIPIRDSQLILTKGDVWETGYVKKTMENGDTIVFFTTSILISGWNIHNASWTFNNFSTLLPLIKFSSENDDTSVSSVLISRIIGGSYGFYNKGTPWSMSYDSYVRVSNPVGSLPKTRLDSDDMKDRVIWDWIDEKQGGTVAYYYGYYSRNIQPIIPFRQLANYVMLSAREGTTTGQYSYYLGDSYATDVNENDQFLGQWKTGNITNTEFKNGLRPWQYGNIQDNEFAPDDAPPYTPPSPEEGDDQGSNTGSVLRPTTLGVGGTNGFITQYSMTAAQIAEIGRLLWLSFTDPDYYKNFLFTLTTTGTLNISNLLDYFVSLRVYPFPLINVPSHAAAGQDMWIGAGLVPLSFNTNLHTINNYADYIDAGSCTIPRYYNDFRDFAHTQIMLYLPYCGTVQLNPADVVGSTLHAQYAVDFATGGVTAYVDCTTWDGSQFVIAVLTGSIGADIPLTASNAAQIAARIAGDALNFAGTVGEAVSSDVGRSAQAIGSAATGDVVGAAIGVANTYAGRIGGALDVAQTGLQIATAEGVKMPMLSGGRGFGSFGAPQTAYVQIRRGIYAEGQQPTQGFKEAYGEAYAKPVQVSSCTGFTVFANVDTAGLQCDAMEREQVKKMMQAGIYI